jgi:hypothetical protein
MPVAWLREANMRIDEADNDKARSAAWLRGGIFQAQRTSHAGITLQIF